MLQKISNTFRYLMIGSLLISVFMDSENLSLGIAGMWLIVLFALIALAIFASLLILTKYIYMNTEFRLKNIILALNVTWSEFKGEGNNNE
jgi:hypothetical protein